MTSAISHSMVIWSQAYILEPMNEGTARINRCFRGVNLHHIDHPKLDWSKRIIDLITGSLLMIPLINTVIWIFIRTFGNAEFMAQPMAPIPFKPWNEAIAASETAVVAHAELISPTTEEKPLKLRKFQMNEQLKNNPEYVVEGEVKSYRDLHVVTRNCEHYTSEAIYNIDWALQSLKYKCDTEVMKVDVVLEKFNNVISITGIKDGKTVNVKHILKDTNMPWIQQSNGYRPFILSKNNKLSFYGIDPRDSSLTELTVEKVGFKEVPGFGRCLKLATNFKSAWGNLLPFSLADCLYNSTNGDLVSTNYGVRPFAWGQSKLIHPSKRNSP